MYLSVAEIYYPKSRPLNSEIAKQTFLYKGISGF
jgi:hypothetical protein